MEYKGYSAKVEFDEEANIFHGELINLRDVIIFKGETVDGLRQAFQESVDDYLKSNTNLHLAPNAVRQIPFRN